jgi:hypothetical protein
MDAFLKNKYLFWAVIVLIALNIVLISMFWFGRKHNEHRPPMPPPMMNQGPMADMHNKMEFIKRELELNQEQQKQFFEKGEEHFKKSQEIMKKIADTRIQLVNETFADNTNADLAKKFATEIGALHAELENLNTSHFADLRKICNSEQIQKFKELMKEVFTSRPPMNIHPMGRGPGRPDCPEGDCGPGKHDRPDGPPMHK